MFEVTSAYRFLTASGSRSTCVRRNRDAAAFSNESSTPSWGFRVTLCRPELLEMRVGHEDLALS